MKKLLKPTESTSDVIALCAISIESDDLRNRLNSVATHIGQEETIYEQRGESKSLFEIASSVNVAGVVTCNEMKKIYKSPFSRSGSRSRAIYDRLRGQSRHGKCPLCAHRDASTLDHYLAKSTHPTFALTPLNLVPSCASCNKNKLDFDIYCLDYAYNRNDDDLISHIISTGIKPETSTLLYASNKHKRLELARSLKIEI